MTVTTALASTVELAFDDALRMAMALHRDMRLDGAEALYRRLLQLAPEDPNVRHFLGMLLYQRGRADERDEAIRLMTESVQADPTVAAWHNNLGNALLEGHEPEAAAIAYRRCIELDPGNVEARNNLGCLLRGLGRIDEAEASFRQALALNPDMASVHANFATLLAHADRIPEAQRHYLRSLELKPVDPVVRKLLGVMYAQTAQLEKAAQVFREWLASEPDSPQARHHLAAVTGEQVPDRATDAYVAEVFDAFSTSFDERLEKLEYRAPRLVGELVARLLGAPAAALDIVDAGAGTGLCAPWLRPYARRLTGVDLSAGMLAQARRRGGYDALEHAELVEWLDAHPASFDLVVSADTLCYFGVLDAALAAAKRTLRPAGRLVFTVERQDDAADYRLQPHGRYSHGRAYVLRALDRAGFVDAEAEPVDLRKEGGKLVPGWLVRARREG
jgi:predicted TPR repeat methyltransferase